jgi:hypothetical protein
MSPELVFLENSSGIHLLDLEVLVDKLFDVFRTEEIPSFLAEDSASSVIVSGILNTRMADSEKIISADSLGLVSSPLLGTHLLVLYAANLQVVDLSFLRLPRLFLPRETPVFDVAENNGLLHEFPLSKSLPFIQRVKTETGYSISFQQLLPMLKVKSLEASKTYPDLVNKSSFELLVMYIQELRENMKKIEEYTVAINTRKGLILNEITATSKELESSSKGLSDCDPSKLQHRLEKVKKEQERLTKRADLCLSIAMELNTPVLNEQEKKWAKEVVDMQKKVSSMQATVVKDFEMLKKLQKEVASIAPSVKPGTNQVKNMMDVLDKNSAFLDALTKSVKELELKVDLLD